jgi:aspartate aminotransferase-like enzyme
MVGVYSLRLWRSRALNGKLLRRLSNLPSAARPDGSMDPLLFTPGPLTTSYATKAAALHDVGSRDPGFIETIKQVRAGVLSVAGVDEAEFSCVPIQGSGTFGIEGIVSSPEYVREISLVCSDDIFCRAEERWKDACGSQRSLW